MGSFHTNAYKRIYYRTFLLKKLKSLWLFLISFLLIYIDLRIALFKKKKYFIPLWRSKAPRRWSLLLWNAKIHLILNSWLDLDCFNKAKSQKEYWPEQVLLVKIWKFSWNHTIIYLIIIPWWAVQIFEVSTYL